MTMKKGIGVIIPMIIILALILLAEYFIVGYAFRSEYLIGRFLKEVPILQETDKIETYVRSFNNAITLSILEGCYKNKDQSGGNLWQDYNPGNYKYVSQIPKKNSIGVSINKSANEYLDEFLIFKEKVNDNIILVSDDITYVNVSIRKIIWDDLWIEAEFESVGFSGERNNLIVNRVFNPKGKLVTRFGQIWDLADKYVILKVNQSLNALSPSQAQCTVSSVNSLVDNALNNIKNTFNNDATYNCKIEIVELIRDGDASVTSIISGGSFQCCQINAVVKVNMIDKKDNCATTRERKLPVYNGIDLITDYLGLIYKFKSGNGNNCHPPATCVNPPTCFDNSDCCLGFRCCPGGCFGGSFCPL